MIKNRLLLYALLFTCTGLRLEAVAQKQPNIATVYGTIKNHRNIVEVVDKDYTEPFQITNSERSFVPDSQGRFFVEFELTEPKYFRIARNLVYLSPGDKLEADIDYNDARNSTFKGSHYKENEYLKSTPYPKAGSFLEGGTNVKSTVELTFHTLLELAEERRKLLSKCKGVSPEFRYLENYRINADLINSFYSLRSYFPYVHKLKGDSATAFNSFFSGIVDSSVKNHTSVLMNATFLKLEVYRYILPMVMKLSDTLGKNFVKINDWLFAKQVVHEMQTDTNNFTAEKIMNIKTKEYRNEVLATYRKLESFNGHDAKDIVISDERGDTVNLSRFKGKIIYIDVWATWCGPCIKEMPYLDSLIERFKDNPNLVFVSLSIDRDISSWINYLNSKNRTGFQFIVELSKLESYFVSEIPRTILIDKNFKIYAMRGPMPSESKEFIEKMLQ